MAATYETTSGQQERRPPALGGAQTGQTQNPDTQNTPGAPGSQYSIPNSSVYLNETDAANTAYEKAKAQLLANRNSLYHQYGLTDTGAVDINNPFGEYQMLLGTEGRALDAADNDALSRGLGSGGLANQGEANLIPAQRLEQLGFQHMVDNAGGQYSQGLLDAENTRTGAISDAYQHALQDALARGLFDPAPAAGGDNNGNVGATGGGDTTTSSGGGNGWISSPTNALAARSAALNARYGLGNTATAKKVAANKTGASANKKQGIFSIH